MTIDELCRKAADEVALESLRPRRDFELAVRSVIGPAFAEKDAEIERLKQPRMFPLIPNWSRNEAPGPLSIPWSVAEKAYGVYASRYISRTQSLERLAERGGFGVSEMDDLYPQWRAEVDRITELERDNDELRKRTISCCFCHAQCDSLDALKAHSAECREHPLWKDAERLSCALTRLKIACEDFASTEADSDHYGGVCADFDAAIVEASTALSE